MDLQKKIYTTNFRGEQITLEVSRLAGKANAAVFGKYGGTTVLATVVMGQKESSSDFFPLAVEYEERFYAAGKILGSRFVRREGKPSDDAILSGRLIDRTIRPLFDHRLRREVQVTITILSYEEAYDPDVIGLLSASAALAISDVPWGGPVAGVKAMSDKNTSDAFNAFFAGTESFINMIELEGKEIPESLAHTIFSRSHEEIKHLIEFQKGIVKEIGKPKAHISFVEAGEALHTYMKEALTEDIIRDAFQKKTIEQLREKFLADAPTHNVPEEEMKTAAFLFDETTDKFLHTEVLLHDRRPDGRKLDEIRELHGDIHLFDRTHGSGLFIRGETQVLAITTLGNPSTEQIFENMESSGTKKFMLHYNFPSFATGEAKRSRGPGRREIGHGALAAKAFNAVLPEKSEFPYTIRVVAETLSSNGSSSMATVCGTTLSLMDAGVPLKKHVAGISIGLITGEKGEYKLLTDIQGPEDHHGDMDFKVAGTDTGINAIQMDVKIGGITLPIFQDALERAKTARTQILGVLKNVITEPRKEVSQYAPTIFVFSIPKEKIGELIGPGGRVINGIIEATGGETSIDIEQDGTVYVSNTNQALAEQALAMAQATVKEYKAGEIVEGNIVRILDFGAIVDLGGGRDGMIHVSELKSGFVKKVEDVVKLGDFVRAKVVRVEDGKIALSLKALSTDKPEK